MLPGKVKGIGGAMDLVANPEKTKVVVTMVYTSVLKVLKALLTATRITSTRKATRRFSSVSLAFFVLNTLKIAESTTN